jgi:hypothetical protein
MGYQVVRYDYESVYKNGVENLVTDALSRIPEHSYILAIYVSACATLDQIKKEKQEDLEL